MADNNKVTIDAAWFAELYETAKQFELEHSACHLNGAAIALMKERDELKRKLEQECASCPAVKERDELKVKLAEHADLLQRTEAERVELQAALERANQTNSAQADQLRDAMNALEQERMNKCDEVTAKRLAAAERCIESVMNTCKNCKANINGGNYGQAELNMDYCIEAIRAYREKKEAK